MIMKKHNAAHNYFNAAGSQDKAFMKDLVLNDVSDVIVKDKPMVIAGLKNAGIAVDKDASVKKVASLVADNAGTNKKFTGNMTKLVQRHHAMKGRPEKLSFGEDGEGPLAPIAKAAPVNPRIGAGIFSSIANVFTAGLNVVSNQQEKKMQQEQTKQKLIDLAMAKANGFKQGVSGLSTGAKIGITVGILAALTGIGYLIFKK